MALSKIHASEKNDDHPNGVRMQLVPEINSMISPATKQSVSRLRTRQDTFQQKVERCVTWDIDALDFADPTLGRSLGNLLISLRDRLAPEQASLPGSRTVVHFVFLQPHRGAPGSASMRH